jgi:hypothetical protein
MVKLEGDFSRPQAGADTQRESRLAIPLAAHLASMQRVLLPQFAAKFARSDAKVGRLKQKNRPATRQAVIGASVAIGHTHAVGR